jgi:hypothetical protein
MEVLSKFTVTESLSQVAGQGAIHLAELQQALEKVPMPTEQMLRSGLGIAAGQHRVALEQKIRVLEGYISFTSFLDGRNIQNVQMGKPELELFGYLPDPMLDVSYYAQPSEPKVLVSSGQFGGPPDPAPSNFGYKENGK